jgi:hypothetical protein
MKTSAFAIALLMLGGAASAQTADPLYAGDGRVTAAYETDVETTLAWLRAGVDPAQVAIVQAGNSAPERDARGIAVLSDPALVPAGWNGVPNDSSAMGGPLLDPVTGEEIVEAPRAYPACSARVTDNCLQTYEKGRRS